MHLQGGHGRHVGVHHLILLNYGDSSFVQIGEIGTLVFDTIKFEGHATVRFKGVTAGLPIAAITLMLTALSLTIHLGSITSMQVVPLHSAPSENEGELLIAVISDLHVEQSDHAYRHTADLFQEVLEKGPDLIFLLGDLTASPSNLAEPGAHRASLSKLLALLPPAKTAVVLGNYESWDDRSAWRSAVERAGLVVLENDVSTFDVNGTEVCVRGLGDFYTGNYQETYFSSECEGRSKITITHDPAAAFQEGVEGLIFAGHTHCGQISIPFLGPLWAPTEAPRDAWCGLYQDELRTLWVSSGVGTSVLPIRLGAPSQWDLVEVRPRNDAEKL